MTTVPKELLIQARDALEEARNGLEWFKESYPQDANGSDDEANERLTVVISAMQAAIDQPEPEPVAWYDGKKFYATEEAASMCMADMSKLRPLYTHTAPAKPLTDEKIQATVTKAVRERKLSWIGFKQDDQGEYTIQILSPSNYQLFRVAKAAHSIGVKP